MDSADGLQVSVWICQQFGIFTGLNKGGGGGLEPKKQICRFVEKNLEADQQDR